MRIVHHHANGRFDWLISGHQSVNPSREEFLYCLANIKDLGLSILGEGQLKFECECSIRLWGNGNAMFHATFIEKK